MHTSDRQLRVRQRALSFSECSTEILQIPASAPEPHAVLRISADSRMPRSRGIWTGRIRATPVSDRLWLPLPKEKKILRGLSCLRLHAWAISRPSRPPLLHG